MKTMPLLRGFAALAGGLAAARLPALDVPYDYHVAFIPENALIGHYSASKKPVLEVPSGAVVKIDGGGGGGAMRGDNPDPVAWLNENHVPVTPGTLETLQETARVQKESAKAPGGMGGHLIVGPIYVDGAEPGDMLEVRILDVTPRITFGVTGGAPGRGGMALGTAAASGPPTPPGSAPARAGGIPRPFGKVTILDIKRNAGIFENGIEVPLKPFMGVMATCPADSEGPNRGSRAPGAFGGNLDCSELCAGSTLYLPVFQKGALFYTGDSHAGQGDGEVTGTAIETADACTLQFIVHKGKTIAMPRAETPTDYIVFGLDPDLNKAMRQAIMETIAFLQEKRGLDVFKAYSLASIAVNYHVTQVVDATLGVHGMIPKRIFVDEPNTYWYRPSGM